MAIEDLLSFNNFPYCSFVNQSEIEFMSEGIQAFGQFTNLIRSKVEIKH